MKKKILLFVFLTFGVFCIITAQETKEEGKNETKKASYFKFSTSYLTNAVYNGRKDSTVLPYLTPSVGYYDKSGFYVSGALSYLVSSAANRIDLFSVTAGYDFNISNQVSGGVYGSKDFYTGSSTSVKSETLGSIGGNLSYDPGFLTFNGNFGLLLSSQTDVSLGASIAHSFILEDGENAWSISPTLAANLGTQNYYQDYLKTKPRKKNGSSGTVQVQQNTFGLLDYELSLPIGYDAKKWGLFFTPTYAIPQNPASYTSPGGNVFIMEKLENVFYAEFGVYVKF